MTGKNIRQYKRPFLLHWLVENEPQGSPEKEVMDESTEAHWKMRATSSHYCPVKELVIPPRSFKHT